MTLGLVRTPVRAPAAALPWWALWPWLLLFAGCAWPLEGTPCPCDQAAGFQCCADGLCHRHGCGDMPDVGEHGDDSAQEDAGSGSDGEQSKPLPKGATHSMLDFVPMFDAHDIAHDADRKMLYVSGQLTQGAPWRVHRYDLERRALLEPFEVEGEFWGLSLSPDGRHLVVADVAGEAGARCHIIDLDAGFEAAAIRTASYELEQDELRPLMPLFMDDNHFLVSSAGTEPVGNDVLTFPLRKFDITTLASEPLLDETGAPIRVSAGTVLARSDDGAYLLFAQTGAPLGRLVRYEAATARVERTWTNFNLGDARLNHDGSQMVAPSYAGLVLQDRKGLLRAVPQHWSFDSVRDAIFDRKGELLYLTPSSAPWAIEAYHTKTQQTVHVVEPDPTMLDEWTTRTFAVGRLLLSQDGKLLFAHVKGGVGLYAVGGEGEQPDATVHVDTKPVPSDDYDTVYDVPEGGAFSAVVPVLDARDVVHDIKRNVAYATTLHGGLYGSVMRWPLDGSRDAEPLELDGKFSAIDISPSQDTLAVVDENGFLGHLRVHVVDLTSRAVRAIDLPWAALDGVEKSAHDLVFVDDHTLLVSASALDGADGPVPLRRVDVQTGNVEILRELAPDAVFSRSGDGSQVAISWVSHLEHTVDHYYPERAPDQAYEVGVAQVRPYGLSVSRDGAQVAVPSLPGVLLFDAQGSYVATLGESADPLSTGYEARPFSVLYSLVTDRLYIAWSGAAPDEMQPSIDVYDTASRTQVGVIEPLQDLYWDNKNLPFSIGRMRMSKDGSHLFAVSTWGVAVYDLAADGTRKP